MVKRFGKQLFLFYKNKKPKSTVNNSKTGRGHTSSKFRMRNKKVIYFGFCLVLLVLIVWRYQVIESRIKNNELRRYNDSGEAISLVGKIIKEPDVREKAAKLTIETRFPNGNQVSSRVLVTVSRYPEYRYGDELKIRGELKTPAVFEDFNYKNYLKKQGIFSVIYWPEIELVERKANRGLSSLIYAKILDFKERLRTSIYSSLSPPQSSILGAMILGDKSRISNNLKEKLNIAGVRHITAVSGMHVVILSSILMSLLLGLGFWRGQAFYFSIIIIFLFIVMTGFQPSGVRAGIMGGLFLLGQKIGRKSFSPRAIVIAAALMLAVNPLLLLYDVGFQLSFLAAMGIVYLSPTFQRWLKFVPAKNLRTILSLTFSAYLFTLPILIYNFGRISLAAPLSNVLILPAVQWIMISGFIFSLAGIIWQALGWILSFPCWLLLTYSVKITDFFSQPWAAKTIENLHWSWLIISYLILAVFVYWLRKREKLKFLNY